MALALHMLTWVPSTASHTASQALPGVIPECRARSKPEEREKRKGRGERQGGKEERESMEDLKSKRIKSCLLGNMNAFIIFKILLHPVRYLFSSPFQANLSFNL